MSFDKYKKLGAYHHRWYYDKNHLWYKECVYRVTKFCKGDTLDVGCGDGLVMKLINQKYSSTGIDNSLLALEYAHEIGGISKQDLWLQDIETLNLPAENQWEYLCCLNSIEHLKKPQALVRIIKHHVLKGAIIITDKSNGHKGRYHQHEYTKEELMDLFKEFNPKFFEINSTENNIPVSFIGVEITK